MRKSKVKLLQVDDKTVLCSIEGAQVRVKRAKLPTCADYAAVKNSLAYRTVKKMLAAVDGTWGDGGLLALKAGEMILDEVCHVQPEEDSLPYGPTDKEAA